MTRYLIIKTSAFGDVVQGFPVLQYIKEKDPTCSIDWVVEKRIASLIRAHPHVSRTIEVDAKSWKKKLFHSSTYKELQAFISELREYEYDAVFDIQGNGKSGCISLFAKSKNKIGFGIKTAHELINCFFSHQRFNPPPGQNIRKDYLFLAQSYFNDFSKPCNEKVLLHLSPHDAEVLLVHEKKIPKNPCKNAWMICPASQWQNKQISESSLEEFLRLSKETFQPFFVFIWSNDDEKKIALRLKNLFPESLIADKLSIPTLQHLMSKMQLVISMDSFPLHLAGTTSTPTYSIFGPSINLKFRPLGEDHFSYQGSCPYGYSFEKRCPILRTCATGACLKDAPSHDLFLPFSRWWKSR